MDRTFPLATPKVGVGGKLDTDHRFSMMRTHWGPVGQTGLLYIVGLTYEECLQHAENTCLKVIALSQLQKS